MLNLTRPINDGPWIYNLFNKVTNNKNTKILITLTTVLLGSFLLIISAKIKVPLYPVPMTLQPLAVLMIAMLFGKHLATITIGLYIFKGIIGFPVFAFGGGLLYLMGPTGGFIFGFLLTAFIVGYLADLGWGKNVFLSISSMLIGMFIIYFCGICQLAFLKGFDIALLKGFYPFIVGDFYKLLLAGIITPYIWKISK
ncbi:MAG: hypothetical protein CMN44_07955 [SAR116 cluster bacterium]|nr:hypothetical protein [SAR116 cluster bacterium]RPH08933.1 MAG: biotin transporter BioY [Alphaproteobacteria bacterium TMED54]